MLLDTRLDASRTKVKKLEAYRSKVKKLELTTLKTVIRGSPRKYSN